MSLTKSTFNLIKARFPRTCTNNSSPLKSFGQLQLSNLHRTTRFFHTIIIITFIYSARLLVSYYPDAMACCLTKPPYTASHLRTSDLSAARLMTNVIATDIIAFDAIHSHGPSEPYVVDSASLCVMCAWWETRVCCFGLHMWRVACAHTRFLIPRVLWNTYIIIVIIFRHSIPPRRQVSDG